MLIAPRTCRRPGETNNQIMDTALLTIEQPDAVRDGKPVSLQVEGTPCVLVRRDVFERLESGIDSTPWTDEEMNLLADEAHEIASRGESHAF